jgi:nitroreductase
MNLYDVIKARRSVRQYLPTPVEKEKLARIYEAVRQAPSACNLQPWRFLILKTAEYKERLDGILQDWAMQAPYIVVALGNRKTAWQRDGESIHPIDVAIAVEHLILAATAEGLGSCWICAFDREAMGRVLNPEPEWEIIAATPLGYPNDSNPRTERKPLTEIIEER